MRETASPALSCPACVNAPAWRVFTDRPADVWAIGCIMAELMTCKPLFWAKTSQRRPSLPGGRFDRGMPS